MNLTSHAQADGSRRYTVPDRYAVVLPKGFAFDIRAECLVAVQIDPPAVITLTPAEVSSGYDRVKWAEGLIRQLPVDHEGRNNWLMNYGDPEKRAAYERNKACDEMFGVLLNLSEDRKLNHSDIVEALNRSDIVEALYDAGYRKP